MAATTASTFLLDHHHHHSPISDIVDVVYENDDEDRCDDPHCDPWALRNAEAAKPTTFRSENGHERSEEQHESTTQHTPPSSESARRGLNKAEIGANSRARQRTTAESHNDINHQEILVVRGGIAALGHRQTNSDEEEGSTHLLIEPLLSPGHTEEEESSVVGIEEDQERGFGVDDNWFLECCEAFCGSRCANLIILLRDLKRAHQISMFSYVLNVVVQIICIVLSSKNVVFSVQDVYSDNPTLLTPPRWTYLVMWIFVIVTDGMFAICPLVLPSYRAQRNTQHHMYFVHLQLGRVLWTVSFSLQWLIPATICVLYILVASVMAVLMGDQKQQSHDGDNNGNHENAVDGSVGDTEVINSDNGRTVEGNAHSRPEEEEREEFVTVLASHQSCRGTRLLTYCVMRFPFELHLGWAAVVLAVHFCILLTSRFQCGDGIHLAWAIASLSILLLVAIVFLFGGGTQLCLCFCIWHSSAGSERGGTWVRNSSLQLTPNLVVPMVVAWSFLGIGWELHSQMASSERGFIFVDMTTDFGIVVTTGISCASYMFAALVGALWIPKLVHQITRDYLTIGVVEIDH